MTIVPDHLFPTDGLTDSRIEYAGFDRIPGSAGATHRFDILDEKGLLVGTFKIRTTPTKAQTIDSMVAKAHTEMTNVLRQWLYVMDAMRQQYRAD